MKRESNLEEVCNAVEPYDFCIVGGGATGLGAAVDAASRGHSVVLIEQADFAKGTSSRSTKLVHGGVRYLQQGNVSLVLEALRERGRLTRNAPHLVHDLSFVIPNYSWWEGPFDGIGIKVYDQLAGKLGLGPSRWLSKAEDGRVLFAVPWHGCVVVGTTDTPLTEKSLEPRALAEEVKFVMDRRRGGLVGLKMRQTLTERRRWSRP